MTVEKNKDLRIMKNIMKHCLYNNDLQAKVHKPAAGTLACPCKKDVNFLVCVIIIRTWHASSRQMRGNWPMYTRKRYDNSRLM